MLSIGFPCFMLWWRKLPHVEESQLVRNGRWPLANSQQGTETVSTTSQGKLNAANKHWVILQADLSPVESSDETADPEPTPYLSGSQTAATALGKNT